MKPDQPPMGSNARPLYLRGITLGLLAALLAACGGQGIRPGVDDQRHWQLSGKIGLRGPRLAESAYLNWRQCGDDYDVRISGPLGQTVARIAGRGDMLTVSMEGRDPVTTAEPEQLLQEQLGWSVPLRALRYWVRAEAAPGSPATITGPQRQPNTLQQLGWQVDYLNYHVEQTPSTIQTGDGLRAATTLPAKLTLRGGDLQATLLINDWLLSDAVQGCPNPGAITAH